jgi:O-antigen biosynthesis protein
VTAKFRLSTPRLKIQLVLSHPQNVEHHTNWSSILIKKAADANQIAQPHRLARGTCLAVAGVIVLNDPVPPILPNGKFFRRGSDKFFLKVVRFGVGSDSLAFEEKIALGKRLRDLHAAHTTAVLVAEDEAHSLLALASQVGLYALVELKFRPEDLFSRRALGAATSELRDRVANLRGYPGVIAYLLDCPLEPDTLRCRGLEIARARLTGLLAAIRDTDRDKMAGMKHRACTLALTSHAEDFVCAVMPALAPGELRSRVVSLHNIAQARPLLLEFDGMTQSRDEFIASGFGLGAAGVVVKAPGDDEPPSNAFKAGSLSLKMLHASEILPFLALNGTCPPQPTQTPKLSVIICAYNAERTMRQCLESLCRLDYPNFEVIIVDDGSVDATAQIAAEFPEFRLIRQSNKGLSVARNVGMQAALGELVAYTDSDCVVDPHWLTFMVRSTIEGDFDACGGPNYAPHEDGWVEGCVAAAPGAPSPVLIANDRAEHLAGCNMVFRRRALEEVGGFDPQFTAAGDDVDICWRLIDAGYFLGYCPSAFVWHFRRNTIKGYYGQQRGYGKAEAALYFKYPERFNVLGQIKWQGTIPGMARTMPGGGRLRVQWGRVAERFQQLDEMPLSVLTVAPLTPEWSVTASTLVVLSLLFGVTIWPALAALMAGPVWAAYYALRAPLEKCHRGAASRLLIAWLAYSGSFARTISRYRCRFKASKRVPLDRSLRQQPTLDWKQRSIRFSYWNSVYTTRESVLESLRKLFRGLGCPVVAGSGWSDYDLLVAANSWTRIQLRTAEEELGGLELKTNVAARVRLSPGARVALSASVLLTVAGSLFGPSVTAIALCLIAVCIGISAIAGMTRGARIVYRAIEQCAAELNLVPLGKLVAPAESPSVPPPAGPEPAEVVQPSGR